MPPCKKYFIRIIDNVKLVINCKIEIYKIFLISLSRENKENIKSKKKINSILKFEYIDISRSKNIDQNDKENILELLAIEIFKKEQNYEIVILFSNNGIITLNSEVIEIELDNIEKIDDKN